MSSTQPILGVVSILQRNYYRSTRAAGTFTLASFRPKVEIPPVSPGQGTPLEQEHACE